MQIKDVETLVGITKKNIRYYEKEGLLSPERNSGNDYRNYSEEDIEWLKKIKLFRKLSVPIEEIRLLKEGHICLEELLDKHTRRLDGQMKGLMQTQLMCSIMAEQSRSLQEIDATSYLIEMEHLEQEGVSFVDSRKTDIGRKYIGAILPAAVSGVLFLAMIIFMMVSLTKEVPFVFSVLTISIPVVLLISIIAALNQRIKEIKGGEEDAASKY